MLFACCSALWWSLVFVPGPVVLRYCFSWTFSSALRTSQGGVLFALGLARGNQLKTRPKHTNLLRGALPRSYVVLAESVANVFSLPLRGLVSIRSTSVSNCANARRFDFLNRCWLLTTVGSTVCTHDSASYDVKQIADSVYHGQAFNRVACGGYLPESQGERC